jgi:hypothetical protein
MKYILLSIILLCACEKKGIYTKETKNPNFEVTFLFEYDGIKMYRFYDGGYHYFTSCGETISEKHRQCGKVHTYYDENIK